MMVSRRRILPVLGLIGIGFSAISPWHGRVYANPGLPDALQGSFRGTITGPAGANSGDFTVVIGRMGDGFVVRWSPRQTVEFYPAGRPGVFRTNSIANPLAGETARWARLDGKSLIVYSMQVDEHGGYDILNYNYAPSGGGLDLVIRRIRSGAEPVESKGRLEKYGR